MRGKGVGEGVGEGVEAVGAIFSGWVMRDTH